MSDVKSETTAAPSLATDAIRETWANILLPERYLGVLRYSSQEEAREQERRNRPHFVFVTENGKVPARADHVVAQVKL